MAARSGPAPKKEDKPKEKPVVVEEKPTPVNKEAKKELQRHQKMFQQLEENIAKLKADRIKLEASLSSPDVYSDKNKYAQAETAYKKASAELDKLNKEYEQVFEKIVELEG